MADDRREQDARAAVGRLGPVAPSTEPGEPDLPETERPARVGDAVRPTQGMGGPIGDGQARDRDD
jgi:hypothetical protein